MGGSWHCFTHITSDPATGYRGIQSSKPQDTNLCAIHAKRVTIMPKDSHFLFCLGQICSYGSYGFGCKEHDGIHCFEESEIEQQVLQWWYLVFVWKRFVCLFGTHILAIKYIWTCMERPARVIQIQRCCLAFFLACVPQESASLEQKISAFPAIPPMAGRTAGAPLTWWAHMRCGEPGELRSSAAMVAAGCLLSSKRIPPGSLQCRTIGIAFSWH